ncbi:CHRD domain-containing protein [Erythrobacter sp. Dej080120_24]|uniref:CHRD domain-containing protein n=1 Tax=Erythrobacter sp. Dej080120_24 TaxID=3024837 RepID=UPI0030C65D2E
MNWKTAIGKPMNAFGLVLVGVGALGMAVAPAQADDEVHSLGASLFGEYEVDHEGAGKDAGGDFTGEIDMGRGTLCYYLEVYGLDEVTAAHIHKGKDGENGPPVVVLEFEGADRDEVCLEVEAELLADMARHEERYYVNVHTAAYPAGAIRGQLGS